MFEWLRRGKAESNKVLEIDGSEFGFPFKILKVHGSNAISARAARLGVGVSPIIMGSPDDVEPLREIFDDDQRSPQDIIDLAAAVSIEEWKARELENYPELARGELGKLPRTKAAESKLTVHLEGLLGRPKKLVLIGLIPAKSWETPAHIKFGGWNECPEPHVHVALHKYWNLKYGAEIACLSGSTIECTVEKLPKTQEEALELAIEQALYCPDIIDQGVGSLENLVALLLGSKSWYFWWD